MTKKMVLGAIAFVLLLWLAGFGIFAAYAFHLKSNVIPKAGAIVVLTGGTDRIRSAHRLLQQSKADALFISGVNSRVSVGALFQEIDGDLVDKITLGYDAENTRGNAMEVKSWIQEHPVDSIVLVTSFYHMPRSLLEISRQIPDVYITPYPVMPKTKNGQSLFLRSLWLLFLEYNKFLVVSVQGVVS